MEGNFLHSLASSSTSGGTRVGGVGLNNETQIEQLNMTKKAKVKQEKLIIRDKVQHELGEHFPCSRLILEG